MYLDDCIVYATGTDEFCNRLEQLFKRFHDKHIFLKAAKCKLGMSEVEYVGRTISKDGLRMSEKQIQGVNDIPKPANNTQLRSFLGFINYFRDYVVSQRRITSYTNDKSPCSKENSCSVDTVKSNLLTNLAPTYPLAETRRSCFQVNF